MLTTRCCGYLRTLTLSAGRCAKGSSSAAPPAAPFAAAASAEMAPKSSRAGHGHVASACRPCLAEPIVRKKSGAVLLARAETADALGAQQGGHDRVHGRIRTEHFSSRVYSPFKRRGRAPRACRVPTCRCERGRPFQMRGKQRLYAQSRRSDVDRRLDPCGIDLCITSRSRPARGRPVPCSRYGACRVPRLDVEGESYSGEKCPCVCVRDGDQWPPC